MIERGKIRVIVFTSNGVIAVAIAFGLLGIPAIGVAAGDSPITNRLAIATIDSSPQSILQGTCYRLHLNCVIDLTSKTSCDSMTPNGIVDSSSTLDGLVRQCPSYKWMKLDKVYVIMPKDPSDSALTTWVGPVADNLPRSANDLIRFLYIHSSLYSAGPHDTQISSAPGLRAARFNLPRMEFRKALVRAARQSGPSIWMVFRDKSQYECFAVDEKSP